MGFLSPWFLAGALAAALPLYVHLLKQHRSDPVRFSSLMFMERRTQSSIKHRRLKYLALLAMRIAVILLVALMFANPFIRRASATGDGKKLVLIAVDTSFSMRAGDRLERAKAEAQSIVDSLRPGDRGRVASFASSVQFLTQSVEDKEELRRAIASLQPGDSRSAYGEVSRTLRTMGRPDGLPVEAHVVSDMQRTSLPTPFAELALPPAMKLVLHSVAESREPNWYVENAIAPRSVFQPKGVRVQTTIAGAGTPATDIPVELVMNGKTVETRKVSLTAGGRASLEFQLPDAAYGLNRGEIRITAADGLQADNRFPFAIERREASRILFIHDARSARSATYFSAAIGAVPDAGYAVDAVTVEQAANVGPDRYAAIVISDAGSLPASFDRALSDYVKRGGGVLVALGSSTAAARRMPVTGDAVSETRYASREGERFFAAADVDTSHPAIGRAGSLENVRFFQLVRFNGDNARVLAKAGGMPLIAERRLGAGRVLILASGLDNVSNDLPLRASFVPLMEQSAHYLSGTQGTPAQHAVDSFVELRQARDSGAAVEVLGPDGKRAMELKEAATEQAFRLTREGFYELRRANGRHELIAVHADRRESDLDVIPSETLALWQGTGASDATPAGGPGGVDEEGVRPWPLWWYVCLALLVASIVESLFASRYLRASDENVAVHRQAA